MAPLRPGFTALAVRSGAAILPVAIEGSYRAWPRWRKFPRLGTIHVRFGVPLRPEEIAGRPDHEVAAEAERRIRQRQATLSQKWIVGSGSYRRAKPQAAAALHSPSPYPLPTTPYPWVYL